MAKQYREMTPPPKKRRKKKRQSRVFTVIAGFFCTVIMILQVVCGAFLCMELFDVNLLPTRFLIVIGAVVLVMAIIQIVLIAQKSKPSYFISALLGLCFSMVMVMGVIYVQKTVETLDSISKTTVHTTLDHVSIAVMKDSPYEEILDLKNLAIGVQATVDRTNTDKTVDSMKDIMSDHITVNEYHGIYDMVKGMYDGVDQAIVFNESYRQLITDSFKSFEDDVRIINTYTYTSTEVLDVEEEDQGQFYDTDDMLNVNYKDITVEPFILYMSGIDTFGDIGTKSRSDVNIIATVNPNTKQILLVTTPRDYYVPLALEGNPLDKLTHSGIYGIDCSIKTLENLYGIDINYYMRVNFSGFIDIVDALGGVEVKSDYDFTGEAGGYDFVKGMNHVNGKQALCFVRERHTFAEGDAQRAKNQMHMIAAVVNKATSPAILTKYTSVLESLSNAFMTTLPSSQISRFVKLQLATGIEWDVQSYSTLGTGARRSTYSMGSQQLYVALMNEESVAEASALMQQVLNNEVIDIPDKENDTVSDAAEAGE